MVHALALARGSTLAAARARTERLTMLEAWVVVMVVVVVAVCIGMS